MPPRTLAWISSDVVGTKGTFGITYYMLASPASMTRRHIRERKSDILNINVKQLRAAASCGENV
jgi:hypothetical protein